MVVVALFLAASRLFFAFIHLKQNETLCAFETPEEFVVSLFVLRRSIKVMGAVAAATAFGSSTAPVLGSVFLSFFLPLRSSVY